MRVFSLSQLASRERYVIGLLRETDGAVVAGEMSALFYQLRRAWSAIGFRPAPTGCDYATRHELCLLGVIGGLQRVNPDRPIVIDPAIQPLARTCARRLSEAGMRLNHATLARLSGMTETCKELSVWVFPIVNHPAKPIRPAYPPLPGSLQAKALSFVRARGHTSSGDFAGFGVSRQVLSLMFKRGLLVRVRTGVYQAAPETKRG